MRSSLSTVAALLVVLSLLPAAAGVAAADGTAGAGTPAELTTAPGQQTPPCAGHVAEKPGGLTVVSVQGAKFTEDSSSKTAARIVAFEPNGSIRWVHRNGEELDVSWSYDIDPLPNGNLFVTAAYRADGEGKTLLYELDRETGERVRTERLDMVDTHDADVLNDTHVVVANMRNYDEANETNDDRIVVYNRSSDEIEWEWRFDDHYDRDVGSGEYTDDWSHVNDVDAVGEHYFLVSPRNFDQAILIDRRTGDIALRLGEDGDHGTLYEQHNPDYLASEDGEPTFLVADSENDRIVEHEFGDGEWSRTWRAGSSDSLYWPRDADRLPNGNTLIADSKNDRVLEVTPDGEVVWEVFAPYLVYDVERLPGDSSRGPTIADQGATGAVDLTNASPPSEERLLPCNEAINEHEGGWETGTAAAQSGATATASATAELSATTTPAPNTVDEDQLATQSEAPLSPALVVVAIALVAAALGLRGRE